MPRPKTKDDLLTAAKENYDKLIKLIDGSHDISNKELKRMRREIEEIIKKHTEKENADG